MMKSIRNLKSKLFLLTLVLGFLGCDSSRVKFSEFNFMPNGSKRFIRWEKVNQIVSIEFLRTSNQSCLEVYQKIILKMSSDAILKKQNGFWVPFAFFDKSKSAIYGSWETNYNGFVKNRLAKINNDEIIIKQELENLDGENDFFILHFTRDLVPTLFEKYDGESYNALYDNFSEVSEVQIPRCN